MQYFTSTSKISKIYVFFEMTLLYRVAANRFVYVRYRHVRNNGRALFKDEYRFRQFRENILAQ